MMLFLVLVPDSSPQLLTICLVNFVFKSENNVSSLAGDNWCFNMSCIFVWQASNDLLDTEAECISNTSLNYIDTTTLCLKNGPLLHLWITLTILVQYYYYYYYYYLFNTKNSDGHKGRKTTLTCAQKQNSAIQCSKRERKKQTKNKHTKMNEYWRNINRT